MKFPRIADVLLVGLLITAFHVWAVGAPNPEKKKYYPIYPPVNYQSGAGTKAQIQKGEYLAKAGDCIACHTDSNKPNSPAYAGGFGLFTPIGMAYTPNITPDKEYGIGKWTFADFKEAMRHGVRPEGQFYFPMFPYTSFTYVKDEDLHAIWAYLQSIPAVAKPDIDDDLMWPFGWRFLQLGWRILFFYGDEGPYEPNPDKSAQWNRGAYLVNGLGHCTWCHSPLTFGVSPSKKYFLTGNFIEGYYAPDITSRGLGRASVEQVMDVFRKNTMISGGPVKGPMLEVNTDSLSHLKVADLRAIAVYLKSVKSDYPKSSSLKPTPANAKKIYDNTCAQCHASGGAGAPRIGDKEAWAPILAQGTGKVYDNAIHGIGSMPPKGTCVTCSNEMIKAVVDYMIKVTEEGTGKSGPKATAPKPTDTSLALGKKVYTKVCSTCHAKGLNGAPKFGDKKAWKPLIEKNVDVLFEHALAGYKNMPPKSQYCPRCTTTEVQAAVKYMVTKGNGGDYTLW